MHRFSFYRPLICASLGLVTPFAFAALQPVAEAPLASETDIQCHFNADASSDCTTTYRFTILKPTGRELLSRIDYNFADTDTLEILKAESTQPGGKPIALKASQIDTRTAPNPDQGFSRVQQTSLAFPNLRVGTRINYTLREHTSAKPLLEEFHHRLSFGVSLARRDSFKATFTAERPIQWRSELMEGFNITASNDQKRLVVEQKEPTYLNYINESSNAFMRLIPRVELGSSLDKQAYFGKFAQRYNQIIGAKLPADAAAAVARVQDLPPAKKVAGLMQHINDNYRYLGDWRASDRGYVPFSLEQIEQHGYGDCKDLAVLLAAMLKASGINAEAAWVSRGDVADSLLIPGAGAPNHAIVRAQVNDQVWWLDPTNPVFAPGRTLADIQQRWVLVAGPDAKVREEQIPLQSPDTSLVLNKQEHYQRDGKARVSATVEFSALPLIQLTLTDIYNGSTSADQGICASFGKEIVDCTVTRDPTGFVVPERYKVTAKMNDLRPLEKLAQGYFYTAEALRERWDSLVSYRRNKQLGDLFVGNPETLDYTVTLSGGKLDNDIKSCQVRSAWYDMDLSSERVKGDYRYHYRLTQKRRWLDHDEIISAPFEAMVDEMRACGEQLHQVVKL